MQAASIRIKILLHFWKTFDLLVLLRQWVTSL